MLVLSVCNYIVLNDVLFKMRLAKRRKSADGKNAGLRIKEPSTCI